MTSTNATDLSRKIAGGSVKLATIGLGYVGLPLSVEFASSGVDVLGIDIDAEKVSAVGRGQSYIRDVASSRLEELVRRGKLAATTDFGRLSERDAIIICVPTPLSKTKDPDLSLVVQAAEEIGKRLKPGQLVVLESTTYPGTTEELIRPILERDGLEVQFEGGSHRSSPLAESLAESDCVVIVTNHSSLDVAAIVDGAPLVIDTRNATKGLTSGGGAGRAADSRKIQKL
jgi:UDP-N-acetyl-D-mannosaminuronate dehydrogenase